MSDLISRQAAIDAVKKNTCRRTFAEEQNCDGHVAWSAEAVYSDVMEGALLDLPSAQPERKTGKLIYESAYNWFRCNVCKKIYPPEFLQYFDSCQYQPGFNFCPNCGAKMEVSE